MSGHAASSSNGGSGSGDSGAPRRNSKRPKYSKFTQQELPACKPILTPKWVVFAFLIIAIVFIPIGIACLLGSRDVVEVVERYENECIPPEYANNKVQYIQSSADKTCNIRMTIPKRMKKPIYVYYQLDNFYQNHRRYVKSRSDKQLKSLKNENDTSSCKPEHLATNGGAIVPCGLIAWSLFNDTYSFSRQNSQNNQSLTVNKKGIAWKSDKEKRFGKDVFPKNFQGGGLQGGGILNTTIRLSEQEDLMVWMRTAALPTFRKLYGKIEVDLEANETINVTVGNNYNTYSFNGKKKLVLSTTSWIGGRNDFLGIAYLTVGMICLALAIGFTVVYFVKPRRLGDPTFLSWNRGPGSH
uniref:ALA-interacting subunit n=1 Tax=Salix viminalis TaxID=40686 RepID=A0A6N2LQA4_SALVM